MSTAVPGWYNDGQARLRWWDGTQWTNHFAPLPSAHPTQTTTVQQPAQSTVIVNSRKAYKTSHGFHLLMSIITLGLWLPVWLIVGIYNAAKA